MKIEYDPERDLLYIWFGIPGEKAFRTQTITPGVMADFGRDERLIGIEVLDAAEVLRSKVAFEVTLTSSSAQAAVSA
jgi:uncharacterized protein YuzE